MARNWAQIGEDFRQKYQHTFCRYRSPLTNILEVFYISQVVIHPDKAPDLTLTNDRAGELYLTYETEASLDFTFPPCRLFNHDGKAYLFQREYQRQWKKGVGTSTAKVVMPYDMLAGPAGNHLTEATVVDAFKPQIHMHPLDAIKQIKDGNVFSVAVNDVFSVGPGKNKDTCWLWFNDEPIGVVKAGTIELKIPQFEQEVKDLLRNIGDYGRTSIKAA